MKQYTIATACRIGINDHLRDIELKWINDNKEKYEGPLHVKAVIKNIKHRYQLMAIKK